MREIESRSDAAVPCKDPAVSQSRIPLSKPFRKEGRHLGEDPVHKPGSMFSVGPHALVDG